MEVGNPSEINEIFDAISYDKGASVIRMLHDHMGDAVSGGHKLSFHILKPHTSIHIVKEGFSRLLNGCIFITAATFPPFCTRFHTPTGLPQGFVSIPQQTPVLQLHHSRPLECLGKGFSFTVISSLKLIFIVIIIII